VKPPDARAASRKFPDARIVLVETKHGGNVGSVCRVMKNFGFERLVLVRTRAHLEPAARELGYGAHDVLRRAEVVDSIEAAVAGASRVVGTAGRGGRFSADYLAPEEMAKLLVAFEASPRVALVFGPEDRGLRAKELDVCDRVVRVPTEPSRASINLSHAVAVVAYAIRSAYLEPAARDVEAGRDAREALVAHALRALRATGFVRPADPRRLALKLERLVARVRLGRRETATLHAILDHLESLRARDGNFPPRT
jgi:TrmH family RNA methyltransferase